MKALPPRDRRGRFTKAKPTPPLPPEVVRALGAGRKPYMMTTETPWEFKIYDRRRWHDWLKGNRPEHEPTSEATPADGTP